MFETPKKRSALTAAMTTAELIYHSTVRSVRNSHRNALVGLVMNILQTALAVIIFWVMYEFLGLGRVSIRGDRILFLMSGVFVYMIHVRAVKAVTSADGPTSALMQHGPMNTAISITSAALGALYTQLLATAVILFLYHALVTPVEIENPIGALAMLLVSWLFGIAVGTIVIGIRPWWPEATGVIQTIWTRANFIASGKMFAANMLPHTMLVMFWWNPLFHIIDQCRGYTFINYTPHYTSVAYPLIVILAVLAIGLLGEFYTRRHVSVSWTAGR